MLKLGHQLFYLQNPPHTYREPAAAKSKPIKRVGSQRLKSWRQRMFDPIQLLFTPSSCLPTTTQIAKKKSTLPILDLSTIALVYTQICNYMVYGLLMQETHNAAAAAAVAEEDRRRRRLYEEQQQR